MHMYGRVCILLSRVWHLCGVCMACLQERLEEPDDTGFCGITCSSIVRASRQARSFAHEGFVYNTGVEAEGGRPVFEAVDSDVVCFGISPHLPCISVASYLHFGCISAGLLRL